MSIGLLGFKTQSMAGRTANKVPRLLFTAFNPGDTSWTCLATGWYTFTLRGAGGGSSVAAGAGAGGSCQVSRLLYTGQVVTFSVGRGGGRNLNSNGGDTVLTLPSGLVVTGGGGVSGNSGGAGGVATGGDINIPGNASAGFLGGAAPAIGAFGQASTFLTNGQDGPGAGCSNNAGTANGGGTGIIYLQYGRPV